MAKFYGVVGYADSVETSPGVWTEQITERPYYGEMLRTTRRLRTDSKVNDDVNVSNELSIISDPFANMNFFAMRYVEFMGAKWKITDVSVQHPRLILTIGGLYNE